MMEFVKSLRRFRIFQHSQTTPAEFYRHVTVTPNKAARLAGLDIFTEGYSIFQWTVFFGIFFTGVFMFNCVFTAYEERENTKALIFSLCTFGMGPHESMKYYIFLNFREKFLWMHQYTLRLYREECCDRTKTMMMDNIFLLSVMVKIVMICYSFAIISTDLFPLAYSLITGDKILPFGFYIPLLDRTHWFGYSMNYMLQILLTCYVISESMGPDNMYIITMMSSFMQIDLLISSLEDLSKKILEKDPNVEQNIKAIVKRFQEHVEYLQTVESVFRSFYFVTFVSFAANLVLALFAVVTLAWYQGYVFIAFVSYALFFSCFLGTILTFKSEQLQLAIYEVPWYKLSLQNQKSMQMLLHASQKPVSLTLIFYPIDMPTFLQMYKTIYSIFTMLLTVREE